MCYDMRRFERMAEEKKRRKKQQELSFSVEGQPEIIVNASSTSNRPKKPIKRPSSTI